jgi:hypothetical protein
MQQRPVKVLLQTPDLLAYGRLGAVNAFTSAGKAASVDNRDKAAKQIEIEHLMRPFGFSLITILTFNFRMAIRALNGLDRRDVRDSDASPSQKPTLRFCCNIWPVVAFALQCDGVF